MLQIENMNAAIGDFQRNYIYKLVIEDYPSAVDEIYSGASAVAENMDLYGTKGLFPESKTKPIKLLWGGEYAYYDGPVDNSGQGVLGFRLGKDFKDYQFWKAWKSLSGTDKTGAAYPRSLTLGRVAVYAVDVDKETINFGVRMKNFKVFHVPELNLDKTGSDIITYQVGVTWDKRIDIEGGGLV